MALGVDKHFQYDKNQKENITRQSIIVLATDGVWEARNECGQMFGRKAVYDIIHKNSAASASEIMEAIFSQIQKFLKGSTPEDDLTLVVVKLL
jgi:sigma-B regulation protein RsbU (phosphoserine phosphatase)